MAKEYLSFKGIPFEEIDVSASLEAAEEFMAKTGAFATPVIVIGDEQVIGWDRDEVEHLLRQAGLIA